MEAVKDITETVAVDLGDLLDAGDDAMVILEAGETRLVVHRAVLADRSPVFAAMFAHDTLEASTGVVRIADIGGPVLRQLVSYLYTQRAPQLPGTAPQLPGTAPQLLAAADKYGASGLKAECERQVAAQLTVETAAAAATLAVRHSCSDLRRAAIEFIKARTHEVMATQGWADAMLHQPKDLIEVSRLLYDPPPQTSAPVVTEPRTTTTSTTTTTRTTTTTTRTTTTTAATATSASAPRQTPAAARPTTPPPDEATVSQMRSLSAGERDRRLVQAAEEGAVGELRALIAAGADVEARGGLGRTALHWAAGRGDVEAARLLVGAGAAVDARDDDGWTPLHVAAYNGRAEVAAALLVAGADRGATTRGGQTALDLARESAYRRLVEMLS
ncbi:poly [ADP-ribose] polymerase tankyrase-1-like isoform X1 [Schistocerca americana]|uniref:poly [ADP-ribose] polymerase tankyrase-1-like isoform X1 n=1 Tax=Schistocerca americana TaxID=7009 RepID=UPI001F4F83CB|nr:poly [ADP-ribose] polymerase tankyrase-1-like isoform X1 [Schistocerca americana]XP_046983445.1 poly [ADP-ribose] polymerase tankyrase-1-like isoform X1 [Schistocerca americana]